MIRPARPGDVEYLIDTLGERGMYQKRSDCPFIRAIKISQNDGNFLTLSANVSDTSPVGNSTYAR
jgi:hypothetical protein